MEKQQRELEEFGSDEYILIMSRIYGITVCRTRLD
jgi:hypothetical protein